MNKNRWRSVDAHFHDRARSALLTLLPIQAEFVYGNLQHITQQITQDTWPRIVDASLRLILTRMYPHHDIIWKGVVHDSHWFGSLSNGYIFFFLITTLLCNNSYKYILYNLPYKIREFRIIIISKMPCHSINASHHCQVRSIGSSGLQNEYLLHYNRVDSVLASGCSFMRQHIWIILCIVLAILCRYIEGQWLGTWRRCMWMCRSGRQVDDFEM